MGEAPEERQLEETVGEGREMRPYPPSFFNLNSPSEFASATSPMSASTSYHQYLKTRVFYC